MDGLQLESLLWVIPGLCFLFAQSRLRDVETLDVSGWRYVFSVVLIGSITVLPLQWFFGEDPSKPLSIKILLISSLGAFILPFITKWIFIPFVDRLEKEPNFFIPSIFWSIVYFFFPLENRDKFIKNCIESEGEAVLVTVKEPLLYKSVNNESKNGNNGSKSVNNEPFVIESRVFFGFLVEFPYVATDTIGSQVIRILPLLSGYNYIESSNNKETIKWTKKYEVTKDSLGIIIPRQKIIHFCRYDENLHQGLLSENS